MAASAELAEQRELRATDARVERARGVPLKGAIVGTEHGLGKSDHAPGADQSGAKVGEHTARQRQLPLLPRPSCAPDPRRPMRW